VRFFSARRAEKNRTHENGKYRSAEGAARQLRTASRGEKRTFTGFEIRVRVRSSESD